MMHGCKEAQWSSYGCGAMHGQLSPAPYQPRSYLGLTLRDAVSACGRPGSPLVQSSFHAVARIGTADLVPTGKGAVAQGGIPRVSRAAVAEQDIFGAIGEIIADRD